MNTPGFYQLKVKNLIPRTAKAVQIEFEIPSNIKNVFDYKAGQYITIRVDNNGQDVRRSYSLCTSPVDDDNPSVVVKRVEGGKMSNYLNDNLKVGDTLEVMAPLGKFFIEHQTNLQRNFVLFGGGSGITPLFGILKTILKNESNSKVILVYANLDENNVIFKQELEQMEAENKNFSLILSYDQPLNMWNGLKGFLTEETVKKVILDNLGLDLYSAKYFICGPTPMMEIVENAIKTSGVTEESIYVEYFTAKAKKEPSPAETTFKEERKDRGILIELFDENHAVFIPKNQTILEAAQDAGLNPPYSCTVGVCTTCRAKVIKGKVEMVEREGLSDAEIEEGYILTCQSHPLTDDCSITYE